MKRSVLFFILGYLCGPVFMPLLDGHPQVVVIVAGMAAVLGIFLVLIALCIAKALDVMLRKAPVYDDHP